MNIEKLKYNFKMIYSKIVIIFYCIMVPISLFIQLPIFLPAILSFSFFIIGCEIIMTIQILRVIYAISILIGFIAGNVIVFNIEKKYFL
ncbi:MAG: hypothetical protein HF967_02275 [Methanosarcinales archaeon]|jgi:hypothetical protein|nr:hypothetical protein [Methanosarcinales archaeon]